MATGSSCVIECVPNFSEGRNKNIIDAISTAIQHTEGCTLLDVDPGSSTNRTVYTFVGDIKSVVEGALNAARVAYSLIDMTKHEGAHPRMGALDVCPFIPVSGASVADCIQCSKEFGSRLAKELNVPIYLYEQSSEQEHRKMLQQIRAGEYEGLKEKIMKPEWVPDYGPAEFIPSWGATATGARPFLIAYNVNILGTKQQAHRIALDIREQGRGPDKPGLLKAVKAIGWYLDDCNIAQVSINLTDYQTTPMHVAFEECVKDAESLKIAVVGSEIVGLVPLNAILMTAEYYIKKENLFILSEEQKVLLAVQRLGLSSLSYFNPQHKIIEYRIKSNTDGPLVRSTVRQFVESLGARTPTPGGGSASACVAAIGTSLATMVGLMTYGKRQYESVDSIMRETIPTLYTTTQELLPAIDADSEAFTSYMEALKLPHETSEEKQKRQEAMQIGLREAVQVPLNLMKKAHNCWPHLLVLSKHGNMQTMSDLQVSARSLETGIYGGYCNVLINLKNITDKDFVDVIKKEVDMLWESTQRYCEQVLEVIKQR